MTRINVVGAGLAGSEAACYLAKLGHDVCLFDMKPGKHTKAHVYGGFGELVCSNSLGSDDPMTAPGLLKAEMRKLGSLILEAADSTKVEAGGALAVDRRAFSDFITSRIKDTKGIRLINEEVKDLTQFNDNEYIIIATGPLTSDDLAIYISELTGKGNLYFFDAVAPIIASDSIEHEKVFIASRYGKGSPDYINCPMSEKEYAAFHYALVNADSVRMNETDRGAFFEGCVPVEELALRGYMTPVFGPLKPVGLTDPKQPEKRFFAVVQLRKENREGTMYNMVGFQTRLTFKEQKRVFSMIPGLENAEFLRYGVMHRNTYINSPRLLDRFYRLRKDKRIFITGQLSGVEGYVESASSGLYAALQLNRIIKGQDTLDFTAFTCIGALADYISDESISNFQPMNSNFGILKDASNVSKKNRKEAKMKKSLEFIDNYLSNIHP